MRSDIEIAQSAELRPIEEIAATVGLSHEELEPFGRYKAKIPLDRIETHRARRDRPGRLVLVTGTNPTPAGEGKSTMAVGLADALRLRRQNVALCLREPSLGPVFGLKGGATGGGYAQVVPMDEINLHFTGDFHAITSAHVLLSAMVDNHIHQGNVLRIDPRRVVWPRAVDMNDRALRNVVVGLGGAAAGMPREDHFVITAASEVMAVFCLASDLAELERRLASIIVGYTRDWKPVRAGDLHAAGAMVLLLKTAFEPNLVQTLEGTPALIHGGPFGNIAHGCNSLVATRAGLALGDIVVTEAGFGSDLGAEKFFDIKAPAGGLQVDAAVIVATVRSLKMHGGVARAELGRDDADAVARGTDNLAQHIDNVDRFGVPPIVAVNRFGNDSDAEVQAVLDFCRRQGVTAAVSEAHAHGGEGSLELADTVIQALEEDRASSRFLYDPALPINEKIEIVAREMYGAAGVDYTPAARREIGRIEDMELDQLPVCIAKTQYSLSDDPTLLGRPAGFRITVREVRASAGAGFVVVKTGDIMTMPGLPRKPAAEGMRVTPDGAIEGLF